MCCATVWSPFPKAAPMPRLHYARCHWTGSRLLVQLPLSPGLTRHCTAGFSITRCSLCGHARLQSRTSMFGGKRHPCPPWLLCCDVDIHCPQVEIAEDARPRCRTRCRIAAPTRSRSGCVRGVVPAEAATGHVLPLRPVPAATLCRAARLAAHLYSARYSCAMLTSRRVYADAVCCCAGGNQATLTVTKLPMALTATTTAPSVA